MDISIIMILQVVLALGLLNVWLLRRSSSTPYRGGEARTLAQEFAAYDLPGWFFYLTGFLKIGAAVALLSGLWIPALILPAAALVVILMLGAIVMHLKVADAPLKFMPAALMLIMSASLAGLAMA